MPEIKMDKTLLVSFATVLVMAHAAGMYKYLGSVSITMHAFP